MPQRKPSWKACVAKMFLNNDLEWSPTSTYPPPHDDDGYDEHHAAMGNNAPAVAEVRALTPLMLPARPRHSGFF